MKKKLFAFILIIMTLLFVVSCEKKEEKATTAYFDFFGTRFDLQDRESLSEILNGSSTMDYGAQTFDQRIDELEGKEAAYVVCRLKCIGDLKQKVATNGPLYEATKDRGELQALYTEVSFEVVEVLEGERDLVATGETVNVQIFRMKLHTATQGSWLSWYNHLNTESGEDVAEDYLSLKLVCDGGLRAVIPRINYEYVLILNYDEETETFNASLNRFACELSTPEDYKTYKDNFLLPEEKNNSDPKKAVPDVYWEILERYNIKVR